jgi:hypothetical protein
MLAHVCGHRAAANRVRRREGLGQCTRRNGSHGKDAIPAKCRNAASTTKSCTERIWFFRGSRRHPHEPCPTVALAKTSNGLLVKGQATTSLHRQIKSRERDGRGRCALVSKCFTSCLGACRPCRPFRPCRLRLEGPSCRMVTCASRRSRRRS